MEFRESLIQTANYMVKKGGGILAADESTGTCTKRFNGIDVESTYESRNEYRSLLFSSPGLNEYINGVILFDETFRQNSIDDTSKTIPEYLTSFGILPGIKVDLGTKPLPNSLLETYTQGIDNLGDRMSEYRDLGAKFAKWRSVIKIDGDNAPSKSCINSNAHGLALYASICQKNDIVPIVEPEVLMDGNHSIDRCMDVTSDTLKVVFDYLSMYGVLLEGIVLKPNMILSGISCTNQASHEEVAEKTFNCLLSNVPAEVPGIAFLSGGQSMDDAAIHLSIMNEKYTDEMPWNLTFSYGRALQEGALKSWAGDGANNKEKMQQELLFRASNNSNATYGKLSN